jgi:hypothetical protein
MFVSSCYCFNAPWQFKILVSLQRLIFGLTPFGWLHTRMLLRVYETQGTGQGCGLWAQSNFLNDCAITIQFRLLFCVVFNCLSLFLRLFY